MTLVEAPLPIIILVLFLSGVGLGTAVFSVAEFACWLAGRSVKR